MGAHPQLQALRPWALPIPLGKTTSIDVREPRWICGWASSLSVPLSHFPAHPICPSDVGIPELDFLHLHSLEPSVLVRHSGNKTLVA